MASSITWDSDIIGSATSPVAPTTTRDIDNSFDGTPYPYLVLALEDGKMAGEYVDVVVYRWNGTRYGLTGETYRLDNDSDHMVVINGGFHTAVTATYSGGGAWAVKIGYLTE